MENCFKNFRSFIAENLSMDSVALRLKYAGKEPAYQGLSAIDQIESRQKTKSKLPSFIAYDDFLFPSTLSAEQSSNEAVARFHASLFSTDETVADLTAGLGIDTFSIARKVKHLTSIERFETYFNTLIHNANVLDIKNVNFINADSIEWLKCHSNHYNTIFIDPARRGDMNRRTFALEDCEPNIIAYLDLLCQRADRILVKCSPMLDIKEIIRNVPFLTRIFTVSFASECKEILLEIKPSSSFPLEISSISIQKSGKLVALSFSEPELSRNPDSYADTSVFSSVPHLAYNDSECISSCLSTLFLFEPDAALMKIAPWRTLVNEHPSLIKVSPNTHLFITKDSSLPLPGRLVSVKGQLDKRSLKSLKGRYVNVVARNFPMSAPQIISRYSLNSSKSHKMSDEHHSTFLYCFRDAYSRPIHMLAIDKNIEF